MKTEITTCIPLDDAEYMLNFSIGYHSHGTKEFPIDTIRIGYPIADWGKGEYRTFPANLTTGATIGGIMIYAARIIREEVEKGNNYAPPRLERLHHRARHHHRQCGNNRVWQLTPPNQKSLLTHQSKTLTTMEPRIIKGKKYLCKKSVTDSDTHEKLFIKGKTYTGDGDQYYPDPNNIKPNDKHSCGFIINELGHSHAWPYIPAQHLWCSDRWTDFFTEL